MLNCALRSKSLAWIITLLSAAISVPSSGQIVSPSLPAYPITDVYGVNLSDGSFFYREPGLTTGPDESDIHFFRTLHYSGFFHNFMIELGSNGGPYYDTEYEVWESSATYTVKFNGHSERFTLTSSGEYLAMCSTFTPALQDDSRLEQQCGTGNYTYTRRDGLKIGFSRAVSDDLDMQYYMAPVGGSANRARATSVQFPNGVIWKIYYKSVQVNNTWLHRVQSVVSNKGYQIKLEYESDVTPSGSTATYFTSSQAWSNLTKSSMINSTIAYCDPESAHCSATGVIGYLIFSRPSNGSLIRHMENSAGNITQYTFLHEVPSGYISHTNLVDRPAGIRLPGSVSDDISIEWGATPFNNYYNYPVIKVSGTQGVNNYSYVLSGNDHNGPTKIVTTVTNPSYTESIESAVFYDIYSYSYIPNGFVTKFIDGAGNATSFTPNYASTGVISTPRPYRHTTPQGGYKEATYGLRGNVTQILEVPKAGFSGNILRLFGFSSSCASIFSCNKAISVTDPRGYVSSYTYSSVHGGILTETGPAIAGVAPQKRHEYSQRYAWVKDSGGNYVQGTSPLWVRVREEFCRSTQATGVNCAGGSADEVVIDYDYGTDSGPNNLLLRGIIETADGVSRRTCYSYNANGDRISETSPAAGLTSCP